MDVFRTLSEKSKKVEWKNGERKEWFALFSISGFTDEVISISKERDDILLFD